MSRILTLFSKEKKSKNQTFDTRMVLLRSMALPLFIFLMVDAYLASGLTPYLILSGPTPTDTLALLSIPLIITCIAVSVIGFSGKRWLSNTAQITFGLFKIFLLLDLLVNLSQGNLQSSFFISIQEFVYFQFFLTTGLVFSLLAASIQSKNVLGLTGIEKALTFLSIPVSQAYFLLGIRGTEPELNTNLIERLTASETAYIAGFITLLFFCTRFRNTADDTRQETSNQANPIESAMIASIVGGFLLTPFLTCFINSSSVSTQFVDLSLVLSSGVFLSVVSFNILKRNVSLLLCLQCPLLVVLGLSRWVSLTAACLLALGTIMGAIFLSSLKDILRTRSKSTKYLAISTGIALSSSWVFATLASNTQAVLPAQYVMQTIGLTYLVALSLTVILLKRTRSVLLKVISGTLLSLKANLKLLNNQCNKHQLKGNIIVSKLNIFESVLVANYLSCQVFIVSNDGFLNIGFVKRLLEFFNTKVFLNESIAIAMARLPNDQYQSSLLIFKSSSLLTENEFYYVLENRKTFRKKPLYSLTSNSNYQRDSVLLPKIEASPAVSK